MSQSQVEEMLGILYLLAYFKACEHKAPWLVTYTLVVSCIFSFGVSLIDAILSLSHR